MQPCGVPGFALKDVSQCVGKQCVGLGQWSAERKERQGGTSGITSHMWVPSSLCCFANEESGIQRDERDLFKAVDASRGRVGTAARQELFLVLFSLLAPASLLSNV